MKIVNIQNTTYHRNGVCGTGFYSAVISYEDGVNFRKRLLVTFEANETKINRENCRVISLDNLTSNWRGDVIADTLQEFFDNLKISNIYDFMSGN